MFNTSLDCPSMVKRSEQFEKDFGLLVAQVNSRHEQVYYLVEHWTKFEKRSQELFLGLKRAFEKLKLMRDTNFNQMNAAELYLKLQSLMVSHKCYLLLARNYMLSFIFRL